MRVYVGFAADSATNTAYVRAHSLTVRPQVSDVLIKDGAITADKLLVSTAMIDKLMTTSLMAGKITTSMLSAVADQAGAANGVTVSAAGVSVKGSSGAVSLNKDGLYASSNGTNTFAMKAADGSIQMKGNLTTGSNITGATITGGTIRTAASGTRIVMAGNDITFYNGAYKRLALTAQDSTQSSSGAPNLGAPAGMYVYNNQGAYTGRVRGQRDTDNNAIQAMDGPGNSTIWLQKHQIWIKLNEYVSIYLTQNYIELKVGSKGFRVRQGDTQWVTYS